MVAAWFIGCIYQNYTVGPELECFISTRGQLFNLMRLIWPRREKTCLLWFANNTGADQPAHPRSLISAFVIHFLESTIFNLETRKISIF